MRHSHKRLFNVAGKLPATTGWQPVLPTSFGIKRSARNRGPIAQDDGKGKVGELTPKTFGAEWSLARFRSRGIDIIHARSMRFAQAQK